MPPRIPPSPPFFDPNYGPGYAPIFNGQHAYNPTTSPGLNLEWNITQDTQDFLTQQAYALASMPQGQMPMPMPGGPGMPSGEHGATAESHEGKSFFDRLKTAGGGAAVCATAGFFLSGGNPVGAAIGAGVGAVGGLIASFF